jgi:ribose transport system permease protein
VLIVLIRNGMDMMNISSYLQMVVMGLLLIFAVVMDHFRLALKGRQR